MIDELTIHHTWFLYAAVTLLSLSIGSLLNVVIYRLPIMLKNEWNMQCCELLAIPNQQHSHDINLFLPRSFCPSCRCLVKFWQNIPIFSYLFLRGRCYTCKSAISMRYPLIEGLNLTLSLYSCWLFGFTIQLIFVLIAIGILICLAFIDLDHQILPDSLTLGLLWTGLIANSWYLFTPLNNAVLSAAAGYVTLWIFVKVFFLITGKIGMGNGDFKLFAAFGAWFGWMYLPVILLLASISGTVIGIVYLRCNNKALSSSIPFGPFLCISALIVLFYGKNIINWYLAMW